MSYSRTGTGTSVMLIQGVGAIDAEEIDRCHVVGHSMGGLIAMQLALMSPRRQNRDSRAG